jgi:outer membrane protein TolC
MKKNLCFIHWVVAYFCLQGTLAHSQTFSLQESIQYAMEHSPKLENARHTVRIRELEQKNTVASLLPSLDLSSTQGLQNNIPIASGGTLLTPNPTAPWYSSVSLGLTEKLYDNGETFTRKALAQLNYEIALILLQKTRDQLILEVSTLFYQLSLSHSLLEVRQQQKATLDKQFRTMTLQFQQGLKTKVDYIRLKTQVQRAEIELAEAQNSIARVRADLIRALAANLPPEASLAFEPLNPDIQSQTITFPNETPKLENYFDYKTTRLQKEANERNVSFSRRRYWPQLSLSSGVVYSNLNYLNSDSPFSAKNQLSWNALALIQYNFWDWGIRKRDVQIAVHQQEIQNHTLDLELLEVQSQIQALMGDLKKNQDTYPLRKELLSLEQSNFQDMSDRYREGKVSYLDLISSLNSLLDSKVQFSTSYFETLQNLAKYYFYEGRIYEKLVSQ